MNNQDRKKFDDDIVYLPGEITRAGKNTKKFFWEILTR